MLSPSDIMVHSEFPKDTEVLIKIEIDKKLVRNSFPKKNRGNEKIDENWDYISEEDLEG